MNSFIVALVLGAAVLHATWNALLKNDQEDRLRAITVMSVASGAISFACLPFCAFPASDAWPALLLSAVFHVAYNLALVFAYRHGDLGQVYPVARGASPVLIAIAAAAIAGERLHGLAIAGIILVSLGIASLSRGWLAQASWRGLVAALATGALIAAYSVTDGIGGRLSGAPTGYAAWLFAIDAVPMPIIYWLWRGRSAPLVERSRASLLSLAGGAVSLLAYAIVIYAASVAPMGIVSALRETSVVFAAFIGRMFLSERLGFSRLASCGAVALGAILLALPN